MVRSPRGLRIAHVQPLSLDLYGHADEDFGTSARYAVPNIASAQVKAGHVPTVHLLTSAKPHTLEIDGVTVRFHRCWQPSRSASVEARFARQLSGAMVRAIRRQDTDIVHFHGIGSLQPMLAAVAWRCQREGIPLVGQDRGQRPVGRLETAAERFGLRRLDAALAMNHLSRQRIQRHAPANASIHLVPNGVDLDVFRPRVREPPQRGRPLQVLVVSRLAAEKDPLTMAAGVAAFAHRACPVELTVISPGPLRQAVRAILDEASVPVTFIDRVPQHQLVDHYQRADVLLLTSLSEGFNQVTIEAMASGIPVVATDIPGVRDGVGDAGILVPVRDPVAVADALEALANSSEAWRTHRKHGLERASALAWDKVVSQMDEVYESVLAKRSTAWSRRRA